MVFDARRKRWKAAGEFDDIPRGLLRRNPKRPAHGQAFGNIDEITQSIRDAMSAPDLTTSDVLDFFATHRRPTIADARRDVRAEMLPDDEQRAANAVVTIGRVESEGALRYAGPDLTAAAMAVASLASFGLGDCDRTVRKKRCNGSPCAAPTPSNPSARTSSRGSSSCAAARAMTRSTTSADRRGTRSANSGAYGVFAETNPIDVDTGEARRKPRRVTVYAATSRKRGRSTGAAGALSLSNRLARHGRRAPHAGTRAALRRAGRRRGRRLRYGRCRGRRDEGWRPRAVRGRPVSACKRNARDAGAFLGAS